jgi:hypothetical protein
LPVLERVYWWASRAAAGLLSDNDLEFRFFEIEEALEDSVANKFQGDEERSFKLRRRIHWFAPMAVS